MAHKVTAPLVVVKNEQGADQYLYEGATVPDFVSAETVKRLTDEGLIGEADQPAKGTSSRSG